MSVLITVELNPDNIGPENMANIIAKYVSADDDTEEAHKHFYACLLVSHLTHKHPEIAALLHEEFQKRNEAEEAELKATAAHLTRLVEQAFDGYPLPDDLCPLNEAEDKS